jgi:hypothetical protein
MILVFRRVDEPYLPFHVEFGLSLKLDFGDFIPGDDMPLCDTTDHTLPLPTLLRTCDVIDRSVMINSYE